MGKMTRSVAVASATAVATLMWGAPAANAIEAKCMYPPSTPVLSIGLSTTAPTAGAPVYVRGRMTYNKCGVNGTAVTVRAGGKTIGTRTTDAVGNYSTRFTPMTKTSAYAQGSFNRVAVKSRTLGLAVRTNLRGTTATVGSRCRVTVKGTVLPVRTGLAISVQRRIMKGTKFVGWATVATARTNTKGAYGATVTLPCSAKVGLSAYVPPTKTNAANRTATLTVTPRR